MQTMIRRTILLFSVFMFFNSCNKKSNDLIIKVNNPLNTSDIRISMEVLASIPMAVVYDGKEQWAIPDGYGENEWYFTYKDTLHGYLRHFKTNRNDKHIYKFTFYQEGEKYFVKTDIEGDSPLQKVIELRAK